MNILEKVFGRRPMGPAEDENSSGGSALPDLKDGEIHIFGQATPKGEEDNAGGIEAKPINGKKVASQQEKIGVSNSIDIKPVQPKAEKGGIGKLRTEPAIPENKTASATVTTEPKGKKESLPRRMDIFENPEGKRRVVQRIEKDGTVVYAEELTKDVPAKKGAYLSRAPLRNFRVSAHVEGMERIDPIKEKHPEFYAEYEEGMEKLAEAFVREFAAVTEQVDTWSESLKEDGDRDLYDRLYESIERIGNEWNRLDDRFVEQGRRRIQLFAEFRLLEEKAEEAVKGDIEKLREGYATENYAELAKQVENGCRKISFEETEKRLNEIAKRIQEKYDSALVGKIPIADDALSAMEFGKRVNSLLTSINAQSSPEETEKVFAALDELEKQTFVERNRYGNGKNGRNGEDRGGFVKGQKKMRPADEQANGVNTEKDKEGGKKATDVRVKKPEWTPVNGTVEPVVIPVATPASENKVESEGGAPPLTIADVPPSLPFVAENTNSMPSKEIPVQEDPKEQEFLDIFSKTFEDLKMKISGAENVGVLKALRPGKGKEKYKFFVLDTFADYFNNQRGKEGDRSRVEAFDKLESAEEELQKLYDARRDQLKEMASKPAGEQRDAKKKRGEEKKPEGEKINEGLFAELASKLKVDQVFKKDGEPLLIIRSIAPEGISIEFRDTINADWQSGKIFPKQAPGFLEQLEKNFGWTLEKARTARLERTPRAKKAKASGSAPRKPGPFDEDDAARNISANEGAPDYEQAKHFARVEAGKKVAAEQPKSQERTYEELEKASSKIERGQCGSVVIEGLKPYMIELERGKGGNPDLKLRDIIEHFGVDEVAKSFVPAIIEILSREWKENERDLFALEFAKKEITGYFE